MEKKLLIVLALAGASVLSAKSYSVTLDQPSIVGHTQLKPGDYKLKLEGSKVTFVDHENKTAVEVNVKVENNKDKFQHTAVVSRKDGNARKIEDITLGGTRTQLDFD
jgi:hypothetical protein